VRRSYAEIGAAADKEIATLQEQIKALKKTLDVDGCVDAVLALSSDNIAKFQQKLMVALLK
jgi:hypothetical protein